MNETMCKEIYLELKEILSFWKKNAADRINGGFYGSIANDGSTENDEERTVVMTSRYLWSYSAAARFFNDEEYLTFADYAYRYLENSFYDKIYGGYYWSVTKKGLPCSQKKQIYGNAFSLYALSEYSAALFEIRKDNEKAAEVMKQAEDLFMLLEHYARDYKFGGYFEAMGRDWSETEDTKLSDKDIDCKKSMNTNLHVMEALTNFYKTLSIVSAEKKKEHELAKEALTNLLNIHADKILNSKKHLSLYFDSEWNVLNPKVISFGHDIEASWLMWEAACELNDGIISDKTKSIILDMAQTALSEGFDKDSGAVDNEILQDGQRDSKRVWWVQAEAMTGFYNAWQLNGKEEFKKAAMEIWNWIKNFQKDKIHGEWFNEVYKDGSPDLKLDKGGNWKTSYHNGRFCMEILRRCRYNFKTFCSGTDGQHEVVNIDSLQSF